MSVNLFYSSPSPPLLLPSVPECELYQTLEMVRELLCSSPSSVVPWLHSAWKNPALQRHCCVFWKKEISYCTCCYLWLTVKSSEEGGYLLNLLSCWESNQVLVFPKPPLCSFTKCRSLQMGVFYSGSCEGLFTPPERHERVPLAKMAII